MAPGSRMKSLIARFLPESDRRVTRQTLWMGGIVVVQLLGGLAQVSLSARILGPEGFGVLAVIIAATSIIHGLIAMPGGDAVTAFVTRSVTEGRPEEAARILRFTLAVSLGLSLVAYTVIAALTLTASAMLGLDPAHADAALLYGLVGILVVTDAGNLAVLRLADRVSLGLAVVSASVLTRVGLLVAALLTGGGMLDIVLAHVAGAAVNGVGLFAAAAVTARLAGVTGFLRSLSIKVPRSIVRFQAGTFTVGVMGTLSEHVGPILVAQFAGVADAGLYRAAKQVVDTARRPFQPLVAGVQPEYSRSWYSREGGNLRRTALRFTLLALALAAAGFGALAIFREPVTLLVLGDGFSGVIPLLLIMSLGSLVAAGISPLAVLPQAVGRIRPSLVAWGAAFAAFLTAMVFLTPLYGAVGAAWANTAQHVVWSVVAAPFIVSILRQSYLRNEAGAAGEKAASAREYYLDPRTMVSYERNEARYRRGRSLLDDYVENDLIRLLFARYLKEEHNILEIGSYSGRITRKLESYSKNITVSDTAPEILRKFQYPKMVLDLSANPNEIVDERSFDTIISIGHQVSLCGDIANAITVFDKLLTPDGILIFDVWNESLPERYDPPYPIQKSSRKGIQEILKSSGFELKEYRSGCRLPFVFHMAFSVLFGRAKNSILLDLLLRLEKLTFRIGLFEGREHSQIFIAARIPAK